MRLRLRLSLSLSLRLRGMGYCFVERSDSKTMVWIWSTNCCSAREPGCKFPSCAKVGFPEMWVRTMCSMFVVENSLRKMRSEKFAMAVSIAG